MLKFSKNIFFKEKMFVKESEEYIFRIFWNILFLKWNIPLYLFIYLFIWQTCALKRPRSYWCLGVLTNVSTVGI